MSDVASRVGAAVHAKLANLLGKAAAEQLIESVLDELDLERLELADHRLQFGEALARRGGVLSVVGRSICTQAILHGAFSSLDAALRKPHE